MVIDTSALLDIFLGGAHAEWAATQLNLNAGDLCMSTVNLTETLIRVRDLRPEAHAQIEEELLKSDIRFVPPNVDQARLAAEARMRFPLNLGDCFVYALARTENRPILSLDRDFRSVDCQVVSPAA